MSWRWWPFRREIDDRDRGPPESPVGRVAIMILSQLAKMPQSQMTVKAPEDDGALVLTIDAEVFAELPASLWQPFQRMILIRLGCRDERAFGNPIDLAKEISGTLDATDLFAGKWSATVTANRVTIRSVVG